MAADIIKNEELLAMPAAAKEEFSTTHILVHCAGIRAAGEVLLLYLMQIGRTGEQ